MPPEFFLLCGQDNNNEFTFGFKVKNFNLI